MYHPYIIIKYQPSIIQLSSKYIIQTCSRSQRFTKIRPLTSLHRFTWLGHSGEKGMVATSCWTWNSGRAKGYTFDSYGSCVPKWWTPKNMLVSYRNKQLTFAVWFFLRVSGGTNIMTPELRISQLWTHKPRWPGVSHLNCPGLQMLWFYDPWATCQSKKQEISRGIYTQKQTAGTEAKCALSGKWKSRSINLGCSLLFNHSPIWYSTVTTWANCGRFSCSSVEDQLRSTGNMTKT